MSRSKVAEGIKTCWTRDSLLRIGLLHGVGIVCLREGEERMRMRRVRMLDIAM